VGGQTLDAGPQIFYHDEKQAKVMTCTAVGILGLGRMGEAIAQAALSIKNQTTVYVTSRNAERAARLAKGDTRIVVAEPEDIVQSCDYVVISLGPTVARDLLPTLAFTQKHQIVSVMAEIGQTELQGLTKGADSACRVLTLPSVTSGGQLLPCFRLNDAGRHLFAENNQIYPVESEQDLMTIWSITGMISATMIVGEVTARWLENAGIDPQFAETYSRTLFSEAHGVTKLGFEQGMAHVSTPNGLNTMVRERLQRAGVETQFHDSLDQIHQRLLKNNDKLLG
jgi:pyrroline-5-carboxylate reductase